MRTYPFIHARQFLPSRPINSQTFTPRNPQTKLRRRLFAASLSTAALLAFVYSVSLSAEPVFLCPNHWTISIKPIEYRSERYHPNEERPVVYLSDTNYCE